MNNDDDLEFHAYPPVNRGGQHITPRPGVLVVHKATGVAVVCTEMRSQFANREAATTRLRDVLAACEIFMEQMADPSVH